MLFGVAQCSKISLLILQTSGEGKAAFHVPLQNRLWLQFYYQIVMMEICQVYHQKLEQP